MKLVDKAIELLGLCVIAIGITVGSAEAHTDIPSGDHGADHGIESPSEGSVTSIDISGDLGGSEDGGYAANLMVDPYINSGGSE